MNYLFLIITLVTMAIIMFIVSFTKIKLTNEGFDRLKWLAIKWSLFVTFIGVLVSTFKFDYGEETVTIVAAIGALISNLLETSNKTFKDGAAVDSSEGGIDEISDDYYVDAYEFEDGDENESGDEYENKDIPTV